MTSVADALAHIRRGAEEILVENELEERLKEHVPEPLDGDVQREVDKMG